MKKQFEFSKVVMRLIGNSGMALATVMIFTVILLMLGAAFLKLAMDERILAGKGLGVNKAFFLAEAGLDRGKSWLKTESSSPISPVDPFGGIQSYGGGTYQVTVSPIISNSQYEVSSTGRFGNPAVSKTLNIVMEVQSIFIYAAFGDEDITMKSNTYTDSYNSQDGLYGGANIGLNGDIGTNAITTAPDYAISISDNAWVRGDAIIGPGGDIDSAISITDTGLIVGDISVSPSVQELPPVVAPTGLTDMGAIDLDGNLTINTSGQYSSINLDNASILTLDGDLILYVTSDLRLNNNSQLVVTSDSTITIYLDGDFYQESNTAVNNVTKDPTKLTIYGTATADDVIWYSNSEFYGAIYAPNADILINSNAEIYGSIIGNTVTLDSNTRIHYDEALATTTGWGPGSHYVVISWEEEPAVWE
ncbi:hypothetical protein KAS42_03525 [bacterium]|nr:hypothetical protein [bacterium]